MIVRMVRLLKGGKCVDESEGGDVKNKDGDEDDGNESCDGVQSGSICVAGDEESAHEGYGDGPSSDI